MKYSPWKERGIRKSCRSTAEAHVAQHVHRALVERAKPLPPAKVPPGLGTKTKIRNGRAGRIFAQRSLVALA